jgi:hypothetical protein
VVGGAQFTVIIKVVNDGVIGGVNVDAAFLGELSEFFRNGRVYGEKDVSSRVYEFGELGYFEAFAESFFFFFGCMEREIEGGVSVGDVGI